MRSSAFANPPPANRPAITGVQRAADRVPQTVMAIQITMASAASLVCLEFDSLLAKPKLIPVLIVYSKFRDANPIFKSCWPFRSLAERIPRMIRALEIEKISRLIRVTYRVIIITFTQNLS